MKYSLKILALVLVLTALCVSVCAQDFTLYSNGNPVTDPTKVEAGIISAVSNSEGMVAICFYKDGALVSMDFAAHEEGLSSYRANAVVEHGEDVTMKVFCFDGNMKPVCREYVPTAEERDIKIYLNETYDNGPVTIDTNGTSTVLSDGRVFVTYNGSSSGTRFGTFGIPYPDENIIVEADFELPSDGASQYALLMCIYNNGPKCTVYLHPDGLKSHTAGSNNPPILERSVIDADKKFNIAMKINTEELCYDIYYNRQKLTPTPRSLSGIIPYESRRDGFSMYIPMLSSEGSIYVDNIKAYSGTEFCDIGNERPNVNKMDITDSPNWETTIYERPDRYELADKVLKKDHPRIILNEEKINDIKYTKDENLSWWKDEVMNKADEYVNLPNYKYSTSSSGSIEDVSSAVDMVMNLGFAYLMTGDEKYPQRAYSELEVLYDAAGIQTTPEGGVDYWNSYSYLNVSEISFALSICYDWMYDAWTPAQRQEICDNIMEKSIKRAYQGFYGELAPTVVGSTNWWRNTNNWNGVCNGCNFLTAIAFMEINPHMCANIAEGCLRGFEYMLPNYAPMGAWTEGTGYWVYALKYLTASCATLDSICGTDYGIHKTRGLENSMFFGLSCEGKTGVISFGDVGGGHIHAPFMYYWAQKYENPEIGGAAFYSMNKFGFTPGIFDVIYYDGDYVNDMYLRPLFSYYEGTEVVNMSNGYGDNDLCVSMSGGKGTATSHDHIDGGGIIVDKNGVRALCDSGAEHYAASNYFSKNRYWYYKARPEGHNIFVINPQNIIESTSTDSNGNVTTVYYHGQSQSGTAKITSYDADNLMANMDLSEAYSRDALSAQRKLQISGDTLIIEDEIEILSDGSYIEWYFHFKDTATAVVNNTTKYGATDYGTASISEDGKSVTLSYRDYTYANSKFTYPGTVKNFTLSFESDTDFEIEIRDAVRNPYDAEKIAEFQAAGTFDYDYYRSRNIISKIVVKMPSASGTVKLKTVFD